MLDRVRRHWLLYLLIAHSLVGQLLLGLDALVPPGAKLLLERLDETLQLGERRDVRPCVR